MLLSSTFYVVGSDEEGVMVDRNRAVLNTSQRAFFTLLADAVFINPFSEKSREIAQSLIPKYIHSMHANIQLLKEFKEPLTHFINLLEQDGLNKITQFCDQDRSLVEYAFLVQVYLQSTELFDQLIDKQQYTDTESVEVPTGMAIIKQLCERGFSETESTYYLALMYQLRRAYYFIGHSLLGTSSSMIALRCALWNSVFTHDIRLYNRYLVNRMDDFSTLFLGETGTGKGVAAWAVGCSAFIPYEPKSRRFKSSFTSSFTAANLSEYPETLIESEMFGHCKGAFTGAIENHQGVFQRCSQGGTLFLDEVGDISVQVQVKLLRVLERREFTPVGCHVPQHFNGRIIAATHQSLDELRRQKQFRDDLYYRLCSQEICLPTLQQRFRESPEELKLLVTNLVQRMVGETSEELNHSVMAAFKLLPEDYRWPGNVRELEQAIRQILLKGQYSNSVHKVANKSDFYLMAEQVRQGEITAKKLLSCYCKYLYQQHDSYSEVAIITGLDYRTVKKYLN